MRDVGGSSYAAATQATSSGASWHPDNMIMVYPNTPAGAQLRTRGGPPSPALRPESSGPDGPPPPANQTVLRLPNFWGSSSRGALPSSSTSVAPAQQQPQAAAAAPEAPSAPTALSNHPMGNAAP